MFFTLSKIFDFLLLPITWIIALCMLVMVTKSAKTRKTAGISLLLLLILGSNTYFVNQIFRAYEMPQISLPEETHYPVAIILGGGMIREQQEDTTRMNVAESADRFIQAARLYKQGKIDKLLISGGSTSIGKLKIDKVRESFQVKKLLVELGIPKDSILLETQARNTHENALYTKKILDSLSFQQPVLLITSAFHMRRAVACYQKVSIPIIPFVVDNKKKDTPMGILECIIPSERELYKLAYLIREMSGYLIYRIVGYA